MKKPDITVNFYKHHLQFVKDLLLSTEKEKKDIEPILQQIRSIGNNVLDLYTGELTSEEIKEDIIFNLHSLNINNQAEFDSWLGTAEYKTIILKDDSFWVLRKGTQCEGFVHAHPARTGKHVKRLSGSAWKTAFVIALLKHSLPSQYTILEQVNFIRFRFLEMSPVKRIIAGSNLELSLKLLTETH